ncbi:MAG: serine hydrolase domain-containing protein, partial [Hyphomonadaceae bacterium]
MRVLVIAAMAWLAAGSVALADEARIRAHAEAFVQAFNDGSLEAASRFVSEHAAGGTAEHMVGLFERERVQGTLERPQITVSAGGRSAFVVARHSISGAWRNFQFMVDRENQDRLRIFFIALAVEPRPLPDFDASDPRFGPWLGGLVESLRETQPFYGVIAVSQGGRVVYERAFGLANAEANLRNTLATRFNTASGSKMFTAVATMQLVERGVIGLDDPLTHHVPEARGLPQADTITVRHLLTHTSGIGEFWDEEYERAWASITEPEHLLAHVLRNFGAPNLGAFQYSNSNYALLGVIVERASGEGFYDYLRRHVFEPAGMIGTDYPLRGQTGADVARPYNPVMEAGLVALGRHEPVVLGERGSAAGGASTTVADMLAFDRALRSGVLVRPETFAQMRTLQAESDSPGYGYGYGLLIQNGSYGHEGSARGTQFAFRRYDDADVTIVVAS